MYIVKYDKYYNDYRRTYETKAFSSLASFADWLFGLIQGDYKRNIFFANPDNDHIFNGRLKLDGSSISSCDSTWTYYVELITKDDVIIYSTGKFTNGICHWNEEIKEWLRDCRERVKNPVFNLG